MGWGRLAGRIKGWAVGWGRGVAGWWSCGYLDLGLALFAAGEQVLQQQLVLGDALDGFDEVGGDRPTQLVGPLYILRQEEHILRHPERHTERGV